MFSTRKGEMAGNHRSGNRKQTIQDGSRAWLRAVCNDPDRREKVREIIDAEIEAGRLESWWKAYEHGFGRPPQSLDVQVSRKDEYRAVLPEADYPGLTTTTTLPAPRGDQ